MNIPKLRFKEFSGELINNYFFEFGDIKIGLTHTPTYVESGKIFLSSKNISKGYIDFEDVQYIAEEEFKTMPESTKPKKGDILFTRVGSNLGNPIILEEEKECAIFVSLGIFRVNNKANNYYIKHWMDTNYFWNQVETKVAGGAKNNLNTTWLKEFKINIPTLKEQEKIGNFLSSIDKKISLTEEKLNLFKDYKKGMMQKIFSQKLRFKDKNRNEFPDWEEKRLGDILKIGNGKDYKHLDVGKIPVYGTGGVITNVNNFLYNGESVGIGRKGTINKPIFLTGKFWTVDTLFYTYEFKNSFPKFIYYVFNNIDWLSYNEATGVPSLSKSTILKIVINLPCLEEQEKIANFLSSIDNKIENLSKTLENLKEFKKGLLQKMFI